jgi:hypothetical protein
MRRGDCNYNNQRVTWATNYKNRVENKEELAPCSIENMGPRGPKGKLIKLKRN